MDTVVPTPAPGDTDVAATVAAAEPAAPSEVTGAGVGATAAVSTRVGEAAVGSCCAFPGPALVLGLVDRTWHKRATMSSC